MSVSSRCWWPINLIVSIVCSLCRIDAPFNWLLPRKKWFLIQNNSKFHNLINVSIFKCRIQYRKIETLKKHSIKRNASECDWAKWRMLLKPLLILPLALYLKQWFALISADRVRFWCIHFGMYNKRWSMIQLENLLSHEPAKHVDTLDYDRYECPSVESVIKMHCFLLIVEKVKFIY